MRGREEPSTTKELARGTLLPPFCEQGADEEYSW